MAIHPLLYGRIMVPGKAVYIPTANPVTTAAARNSTRHKAINRFMALPTGDGLADFHRMSPVKPRIKIWPAEYALTSVNHYLAAIPLRHRAANSLGLSVRLMLKNQH